MDVAISAFGAKSQKNCSAQRICFLKLAASLIYFQDIWLFRNFEMLRVFFGPKSRNPILQGSERDCAAQEAERRCQSTQSDVR